MMAIALLLGAATWPAPAHAQGARPTGLRFMDDVAYQSIPLAAPPLLGQVPKAVDLSSHFPEPGDQGKQNSCVGWAVAYALKSYQEGLERSWGTAPPQHRFSPAFIYNQLNKSPDCQGGTTFVGHRLPGQPSARAVAPDRLRVPVVIGALTMSGGEGSIVPGEDDRSPKGELQ